MERRYTIRQLTEEFGVTARTLRHYETVGLVRPERKGISRIYSARDRARLIVALRGKRLGLTLDEIRELFDMYDRAAAGGAPLADFAARLERQRTALEQQRRDLDAMLAEIGFFADHCQRMLRSSAGPA